MMYKSFLHDINNREEEIFNIDMDGIYLKINDVDYICKWETLRLLFELGFKTTDIYYLYDLILIYANSNLYIYIPDNITNQYNIRLAIEDTYYKQNGIVDGSIIVYGGSGLKDLSSSFEGVSVFQFLDLGYSNISNVISYNHAFANTDFLVVVFPYSSMNSVVDMKGAFVNSKYLRAVKFYDLNLINCVSLKELFFNCSHIESIYLMNKETYRYDKTGTLHERANDIVVIPFETSNKLKCIDNIVTYGYKIKIGGKNFDISGVSKKINQVALNNAEIFEIYVANIDSFNILINNYGCEILTENMLRYYVSEFNLSKQWCLNNISTIHGYDFVDYTVLIEDIFAE